MKTILSFTIALLMCVSLSVTAQTKDFNGQTYNIKLAETGGKSTPGWQWTTDEISFRSGFLKSKVMHEHESFEDAACTIDLKSDPSGKTISFSAEGKNPGGSKIKWNGKGTGNTIQGTIVWVNMKGNKRTYSFTGTLAK